MERIDVTIYEVLRTFKCLGLDFVAEQTGISKEDIVDIEEGKRKPNSEEIKKFAKIYDFPEYMLKMVQSDAANQMVMNMVKQMLQQKYGKENKE